MSRRLLIAAGLVILAAVALFAGSAFFLAQRADYSWDPGIETPEFPADHPGLLFDESHDNASTLGLTGRYWPFGRLLRADGYAVERSRGPFTPRSLAGVQLLVIANASGAPKPQWFGINIPIPVAGRRSDPAFAAAEIETIGSWVEQGGSLLLIADHAPFGQAVADLALRFGVALHKGFVEVKGESSDPLLFSRENGRLGDHPILRGDGRHPAVERVMTFTGQSLDAPAGAAILLRLPAGATEAVPEGESLVDRPAGPAQAVALEKGKGRVVILGEAAMVTAQVDHRMPYGMNSPGNDNRQFVLNLLHWLSRRL